MSSVISAKSRHFWWCEVSCQKCQNCTFFSFGAREIFGGSSIKVVAVASFRKAKDNSAVNGPLYRVTQYKKLQLLILYKKLARNSYLFKIEFDGNPAFIDE